MAVFCQDPDITIVGDVAEIHFMIAGPLTHITEQNCVESTNICAKTNITLPSYQYSKSLVKNEVTDFIQEVPLADPKASRFVFSFWMYDGEDQLNSLIIITEETKGNHLSR